MRYQLRHKSLYEQDACMREWDETSKTFRDFYTGYIIMGSLEKAIESLKRNYWFEVYDN